MDQAAWILLDAETSGFAAPIFVVEIGAQRMRGWEPEGAAFRKLLNQNCEIPPEASRVHGYTREILERDGEPAGAVYEAFRAYAGDLPLVSFNAEYDLDRVLPLMPFRSRKLPDYWRTYFPMDSTILACPARGRMKIDLSLFP